MSLQYFKGNHRPSKKHHGMCGFFCHQPTWLCRWENQEPGCGSHWGPEPVLLWQDSWGGRGFLGTSEGPAWTLQRILLSIPTPGKARTTILPWTGKLIRREVKKNQVLPDSKVLAYNWFCANVKSKERSFLKRRGLRKAVPFHIRQSAGARVSVPALHVPLNSWPHDKGRISHVQILMGRNQHVWEIAQQQRLAEWAVENCLTCLETTWKPQVLWRDLHNHQFSRDLFPRSHCSNIRSVTWENLQIQKERAAVRDPAAQSRTRWTFHAQPYWVVTATLPGRSYFQIGTILPFHRNGCQEGRLLTPNHLTNR